MEPGVPREREGDKETDRQVAGWLLLSRAACWDYSLPCVLACCNQLIDPASLLQKTNQPNKKTKTPCFSHKSTTPFEKKIYSFRLTLYLGQLESSQFTLNLGE
jgi:hypothetical protein